MRCTETTTQKIFFPRIKNDNNLVVSGKMPIFAVLTINGGTAYVDRKGNQGQRKEDRQQASRIKCTETDAIYLVQLNSVPERK
jgi:hypothetical protein